MAAATIIKENIYAKLFISEYGDNHGFVKSLNGQDNMFELDSDPKRAVWWSANKNCVRDERDCKEGQQSLNYTIHTISFS